MTFKTGTWGEQAKLRSSKRREYFKKYRRLHPRNSKAFNKSIKSSYISHGTSVGYKGEIEALSILKGSKRIFKPCDLEWKGKLVDVKTGIKHLYVNKHVNGDRVSGNTYKWKFLLSKQKGKVDYFLVICKDLDERIEHIFLIPDKEIEVKNLSIPEKNIHKYSKYLLAPL